MVSSDPQTEVKISILNGGQAPNMSGAITAVSHQLRNLARALGWDFYRARGGLFICPMPKASQVTSLPEGLHPKRLHLGCGNVRLGEYFNIDITPSPATDLVTSIVSLPMFPSDSVDEILLEAVLEHLFRHERKAALLEWRRVLRPGGVLVVKWVPDFDFISRAYVAKQFDIEAVYRYTHGDPVPWNAPEQIHKDVFSRKSLQEDFVSAGFSEIRIENVTYKNERDPLNLNIIATK